MSGGTNFTYVQDAGKHTGDKQTVNPGNTYTWTVPAGHAYRIRAAMAQITTSATVGNRTLGALITDGTNTLWNVYGQNIAASGSGYTFFTISSSQAVGASVQPIPDVWLPAGWTFKLWDRANIDASNDVLNAACIIYEDISIGSV